MVSLRVLDSLRLYAESLSSERGLTDPVKERLLADVRWHAALIEELVDPRTVDTAAKMVAEIEAR
jgi:hypothetical protein